MPPLVSVIIPVRNDVIRLQRCLASIKGNDYPSQNIQMIVVDNGSTDGSAAAAKAYGALVLAGAGDSVAALRNQGAGTATGEIVAFVDADHEIDKRWIATAVDVLSDPRVGATGSAYWGPPSPTWVQRHYDSLRRRPVRREDVTWLGSGSLAMTSAVFSQVGGFNASLIACEDVDFCNRLTRAGYRIVADPDLHSIHNGDPPTLKALFFGELWRGRDNLRVTLAGPWTFSRLRSALIPLLHLVCTLTVVIALVLGEVFLALVFVGVAMVPTAMRATVMVKRQLHRGLTVAFQALVVALVFDLARALALVARGSHRARQAA